jgi:hypothetical protein
VPGRNLLFLTLAAALAYRRGLEVMVTGVCETDFSGYPDCRDDTMKAMQLALSLGMDKRFVIDTPLMWIDKADTWQHGRALGGERLVELIVEHTHTCYLGDRDAPPRLGLWLRHLPGLCAARARLGAVPAQPCAGDICRLNRAPWPSAAGCSVHRWSWKAATAGRWAIDTSVPCTDRTCASNCW